VPTPIPPLPALRAFETALRLGGFARAAIALNVSTSAVSHQIRGLEEFFGVRLLERSTGLGGVSLTPEGARLLPAVTNAISLLENACLDINKASKHLTILANGPFSSMWLARRMAEFSASHPEASINSVIQDGTPDFSRQPVDVAVVHVPDQEMRKDDLILVREEVFPVCSPELKLKGYSSGSHCFLLQQEHRDYPELEWRNWSAELGFLPSNIETRVVRYSSVSQAIGAAVGGAGLALGRFPLIESELNSGRLVRAFPCSKRRASWCYVLRRSTMRSHRMVDTLIEFLQAEISKISRLDTFLDR